MKRLLFALACATAAVGGWIALRASRAARALSADAAALTARCDSLEREVRELETRLPRAPASDAASPVPAVAPDSSTPRPAPSATASAITDSRRGPLVAAVITDPAFQNLDLAARRAKLSALYRPLFDRLGMPVATQERFKDLLTARFAGQMDAFAIRQANHAADSAAIATFEVNADAEFASHTQALLGPDGYAAWQDYERTLPARAAVDAFAGRAAVAGEPLTAAQADALTLLLAQTSPAFVQGGRVDAVDWAKAADSTRGILNATQASILRGGFAPDAYLQQIHRLVAADEAPTPVSPQTP